MARQRATLVDGTGPDRPRQPRPGHHRPLRRHARPAPGRPASEPVARPADRLPPRIVALPAGERPAGTADLPLGRPVVPRAGRQLAARPAAAGGPGDSRHPRPAGGGRPPAWDVPQRGRPRRPGRAGAAPAGAHHAVLVQGGRPPRRGSLVLPGPELPPAPGGPRRMPAPAHRRHEPAAGGRSALGGQGKEGAGLPAVRVDRRLARPRRRAGAAAARRAGSRSPPAPARRPRLPGGNDRGVRRRRPLRPRRRGPVAAAAGRPRHAVGADGQHSPGCPSTALLPTWNPLCILLQRSSCSGRWR